MINPIDFKHNRANSFLILSSIGLVIIAVLLFLHFEQQHEKEVLSEVQHTLSQQAGNKQATLNETFQNKAADVRFLANTPPISGIIRATLNDGIDQDENTPIALWQERLSRIFYAFMSSQPEIAQIRYIGKNDNGMELVRVERQHGAGAMRIVPDKLLQSKGNRDYFQKPAELNPDEIYISDISLNREYGRLDYPLWPTYRVATPVYDDEGDFFGIVIINYNAQFMLDAFVADMPRDMSLYMLNSNGEYLLHPSRTKSFEFEHTASATSWQQDFNLISQENEMQVLKASARQELFLASQKQVNLTGDTQQRYINFVVALPEAIIDTSISQRRQASTVILLSIVLVGSIIITIYRKILVKQVDLSYAQSQYSALIEGSRDAILTLSVEGKIEDWNDATYTVLKLPPFSIAERRLEEIFDTDEQNALTDNIAQCLAGKATSTLEVSCHTNTGELLALSISLSPIKKGKQTIVGASTIIRDITEQVLIKHDLEKLNQSLEEQVYIRTQELEKARNEAIDASNMKSSFVANVSHEIRTPLNGILGMHNLLRRGKLDETQASYLEMATHSAKSLLMLINDILDLSKIEAGKLEIEELPVNLIDNFSQAANSMAARAMDKNVEIVLDIADIKHPLVLGDGLRLRQILNNLVSNAIKFTDKGEIVISAQTTEDVANDRVMLTVNIKDTGIGIDKDKLDSLFKAFSQEDVSTTRKYGGTGLGLSIVHNLCSLMGGECHVESEKHVGSTFSFSLSLKSADDNQMTLDKLLNLSHYTVQIVETSDTVRHALDKLLTAWGAKTLLTDGPLELQPDVDIVISQLGQNGADDPGIADQIKNVSQQDHHEQFIFTLSFKQRHSLGVTTPSFAYQIIYRPILPIQLATVISELTEEPLGKIGNATVSDKEVFSERLLAFKGASILIVDDNEINQRVAAGVLEHYGMTIQFSSNGEKAIKLLNEMPDIKLILMDCQMPVMDGFKTTEAIRRGDAGNQYKKIPIIAMTAGAMTGDREDCLNAGMNDYLTKPISAEDLEAKTSLWLEARFQRHVPVQKDTADAEINIEPPEASSSSTDIFWDREASLTRLLSNEDLFLKMLEMFEQQTPALVSEMQQQLKEDVDFGKVRQSAHKLKGSASAIGATLVLNAATELEVAAIEEQEEQSLSAFRTIQTELDRMLAAIDDYKTETLRES